MKFAIRDDDTSFFTKPEDLEAAYSFVSHGPVSLSVVPYAVPHHEKGVRPYGEGIEYGYYPVGDNSALIRYLNERDYDILLHGYSHEYRQIDGEWYPEMLWKDENRIREEMKQGKAYLEELFHRQIRVFVAPNNAVDPRTLRAAEALGLSYSGIIRHRDRDISPAYVRNYAARWWFRLRTGLKIPDVLDYGKHKELVAYPLDAFDTLVREYHISKERNAPFSVYTHYWELNRRPELKGLLEKLYRYVIDDGAELTALSACFTED